MSQKRLVQLERQLARRAVLWKSPNLGSSHIKRKYGCAFIVCVCVGLTVRVCGDCLLYCRTIGDVIGRRQPAMRTTGHCVRDAMGVTLG